MNRNPIDKGFDPIGPGLLEGDSIDLLQDIDAKGWLANLENGFGIIAKIIWRDAGERRTIGCQRTTDDLAVGTQWTHKDIEVFRRTGFGVNSNRITADKKIFNSVGVECE